MTHWASDLIGRPWTPEFNCWALVREVYLRRFGLHLPPLLAYTDDAIARVKAWAGFVAVTDPRDGDVLLCEDAAGHMHAGTLVENRGLIYLLHADGHMTPRGPRGCVVLERLDMAEQLEEVQLWRRS